VLLTQLMVTTGLTALSVQGARNIRAMAKTPLELVEQNGAKVLRVAEESPPEAFPHAGTSAAASSEDDASAAAHQRANHGAGEPGTKPAEIKRDQVHDEDPALARKEERPNRQAAVDSSIKPEKLPSRAMFEAEFDAKHDRNVANAAPGQTAVTTKVLDLRGDKARIQAEAEILYRRVARDEYARAREAGASDANALKNAHRAAAKAMTAFMRAEAIRLAEARARQDLLKDTNSDGIPDAFKTTDAKAAQDFADYSSGTRGNMAKKLATVLPGKTVGEMETSLTESGGMRHPATPGTFETITEGKNSYPQVTYTFPDGTLVRIKPRGDVRNGIDPMFSIEMQTKVQEPSVHPQRNVAFKVDPATNPVPKGGDDVNNPYGTQQQIQREAYERELMKLGHQAAKKDH